MQRLYIIVNKLSGAGQGQSVLKEVTDLLQKRRITFITLTTQYKGHAIELTKEAVKKITTSENHHLIVIGGDGTLNEVVNTCVQLGVYLPITYFAAGTGNDFNRAWQPNQSIRQILDTFLYQPPSFIPVLKYHDSYTQQEGIALNSFGFGLDGNVIQHISQLPRTSFLRNFAKGKFSYLFGVVRSLFQLPKFDDSISINGTTQTLHNIHLFSMMNNPFLGGGIRLSHQVHPTKLSIGLIAIQEVSVWQIIQLFWQIIIKKQTPDSPHFIELEASSAEISVTPATWGQIDGELRQKLEAKLSLSMIEYPFYLPSN